MEPMAKKGTRRRDGNGQEGEKERVQSGGRRVQKGVKKVVKEGAGRCKRKGATLSSRWRALPSRMSSFISPMKEMTYLRRHGLRMDTCGVRDTVVVVVETQ